MKLRFVGLFVVLALTTAAALSVQTPVSGRSSETDVADANSDYEDASVNEVDDDKKSKSKSTAAHEHDSAEVNNRIPIIFSDLSDIERTLSPDGSVAGSGELKATGEHAQSTTTPAETNVRVAPKYMLDLYDKFSKDKYSHPMANIVRSFTNMNRGMQALI